MKALGFIETKGLLAAVEAADAMLKAADVSLLEKNLAGGGLVSITVTGEVSAVQAAVDAGSASVKRIGGATLVSVHVIPRPDAELAGIIAVTKSPAAVPAVPAAAKPVAAPAAKAQPAPSLSAVASTPAKPAPAAPKVKRHDLAELKKMSTAKLRQIAVSLNGLCMPEGKAETADKKVLIEAIMNAYKKREE